MSEESKAAKERLWISDRTKVKVGIASAAAICAAIVGATWATRGAIEAWRNELSSHFMKVEQSQILLGQKLDATNNALTYKWTVSQMEQWANQLDKANRDVQRTGAMTGLNIPDPLGIISRQPAP